MHKAGASIMSLSRCQGHSSETLEDRHPDPTLQSESYCEGETNLLFSLFLLLQFFSSIQGCKMPRGTDMAWQSSPSVCGRGNTRQAVGQLNSRICGFLDDRMGGRRRRGGMRDGDGSDFTITQIISLPSFSLSTRARHTERKAPWWWANWKDSSESFTHSNFERWRHKLKKSRICRSSPLIKRQV